MKIHLCPLRTSTSDPKHLGKTVLLLQLQVLQRVVDQFQELVSDTRLAVGSDAFTAGLDIYAMFKARGGGSGTALDAAKKSLGARFARGPYKKKTPPPAS